MFEGRLFYRKIKHEEMEQVEIEKEQVIGSAKF
jgi:hypothetical protein